MGRFAKKYTAASAPASTDVDMFDMNPNTFINVTKKDTESESNQCLRDSDSEEECDNAATGQLIDFVSKTATMKSKYVLSDSELTFDCLSDSDSSNNGDHNDRDTQKKRGKSRVSGSKAQKATRLLRPKKKRLIDRKDDSEDSSDDASGINVTSAATDRSERSQSPDTQEFNYVPSETVLEVQKKTKHIRDQANSLFNDSISRDDEDTYPDSVVLKIQRSTTKMIKLIEVNSSMTFGEIKGQYCQRHMKSVKNIEEYRLVLPAEGNRQVDEEDTPRSTNFPQQTVIQICVAVDSAVPVGEDAKPVDDGIARCQIIVREGKVATDYTIALTSTFEKLMTTYAAEVAQCDVDSLKFMSSEGMTVSRTMTPEDLYLEENEVDTFDVFRK
eukprot:m.299349 g.299349  ORF g.299349 m.299349 type:complete len:386 (+) comp20109_c0_seq4:441-1598(+)